MPKATASPNRLSPSPRPICHTPPPRSPKIISSDTGGSRHESHPANDDRLHHPRSHFAPPRRLVPRQTRSHPVHPSPTFRRIVKANREHQEEIKCWR